MVVMLMGLGWWELCRGGGDGNGNGGNGVVVGMMAMHGGGA